MTINLWTNYTCELTGTEGVPIAGGLPVDPRLIEAWQQANWKRNAKLLPGDPETAEEAAVRTAELVSGLPSEETGWTTFARDHERRLCIEGRQVKAAMKEASNILRLALPESKNGKPQAWRSRCAEQVFVAERLLVLQPGRTEPDDMLERPIHVMTAQGPRDAIKRTDLCYDWSLVCTLKVLSAKGALFTRDVLDTLFEYAGENGLGADRSQGFGRFTHRIS